MVTVQIDPKTGLLARPETDNVIYETFRKQYAPKELTPPKAIENSSGADANSSPEIELF
jgi:hypothetical protein